MSTSGPAVLQIAIADQVAVTAKVEMPSRIDAQTPVLDLGARRQQRPRPPLASERRPAPGRRSRHDGRPFQLPLHGARLQLARSAARARELLQAGPRPCGRRVGGAGRAAVHRGQVAGRPHRGRTDLPGRRGRRPRGRRLGGTRLSPPPPGSQGDSVHRAAAQDRRAEPVPHRREGPVLRRRVAAAAVGAVAPPGQAGGSAGWGPFAAPPGRREGGGRGGRR